MSNGTDSKIIPTVYVAVGCPGSGKSTWWENSIKTGAIPATECTRVNMDTIRKDLCGDESDQSKNGLVSKVAIQNLKSALSHRIPIIYWDNTSASAKYRKEIIREAKRANYDAVAIWFNTPLDVALKRNANRSRVVPEDVIIRMFNNIKSSPPTTDEGFDNIIYVE